jgi:uncharacterized protein (TIGR00255 family)
VSRGLVSMTGFAARRGRFGDHEWSAELRSVNGKGLDLRLRLPDWVEGLDPAVRAALGRVVLRGSVTVSVRLARTASGELPGLNPAALDAALAALKAVETAAFRHDLSLTPATTAEVLSLRGVMEQGGDATDTGPLLRALVADLEALTADFDAMRRAEGAAITAVLAQQVARIGQLARDARAAAEARRPEARRALSEALARVMGGAAEADPQRVAQELALIAVKADVTEELDRLDAHVAAATALIAEGGAIGRKFDFLTQEFMREANTLCSKAGNVDLTRIGLDLKTVIDQMREQVQNVE